MSIKSKFFKGVVFIAAAKYSGILVNLLVTGILARILSPSDFGIVAIATVFIVFFSLLSDFGIAPAIIQFNQLEHNDLCSIFGFTFWIGIILGSIFFGSSSFIASFYGESVLQDICRCLSLQILFATLNTVPQALLFREKKFGVIAIRNVSIQVLCGGIAIMAALNGAGIYALLVSPILGTMLNLLVNVAYMRLRIRFVPSMQPIKLIASYSIYQFLFNVVNYFGRNLDKLIIGKVLGTVQLGYYEKSYRLMLMSIDNITNVFTPVLHPYLSDSQNDLARIFSIFNRMTKLLFQAAFVMAIALFMCGRELILLVFGPQWEAAIPCFTILTFSVISQIPSVSTGSILQACNRTNLLFRLGFLNVMIAIVGLLCAVYFYGTIEAVSVIFVITAYMAAFNSFYTLYKYCFHTSLRPLWDMITRPLLFYITVMVIYLFTKNIFTFPDNLLASLTIKIILWGSMTLIYLQYFTEYKPSKYIQITKSKL